MRHGIARKAAPTPRWILWLALALPCAVTLLLPSPAGAEVTASFTYSPEHPVSGQAITFRSTSVASPGTEIVSWRWSFDADSAYEDSGPLGVWTYSTPGPHTVRLHVEDSTGAVSDATETVRVNRRPDASIAFTPAAPRAGDAVTFFSTSDDADGRIKGTSWDLDGDGKYDDGNGVLATASFVAAGSYQVGVKVSDDLGATDTAWVVVTVSPPADNPGLLSVQGQGGGTVVAKLLTPFPIVRVSGLVRRRGIRLQVLSVSAPLGSTVSIRCKGKGCPFRRKSRYVTADSRAAALPGAKLVRIRGLGRRLLRTGATMQVFVTRLGEIGKYTRLKVRPGKVPARADRCLLPDSKQPVRCP